ncbi:hypothetical protein BO85DRAFT_292444 [Aspergillus piperis CBS 112811]|uniref:Uncharacterized protein n=1 Tax=Aspergillus piperis CBS 112811 TaxID=1448313 RepID=A0A8G1R0X5_9EURO|nr:hypothetical protein BO85DRAFT_292444 [Aspergillus piperis CBS 112811]RAH58031.1 hypothetical protein BO85DRAFT_292444 [Aspergillus piperis CBS 112811]
MQVHILGASHYPLACTSVTVACVRTQMQSGDSGFDILIQGDQSVGWSLCPDSGLVWGWSVVCLCVLYVHSMCVRIPHTKPTYMHTYVDMSEANCKLDLQVSHYLPACLSVCDMVEELLFKLTTYDNRFILHLAGPLFLSRIRNLASPFSFLSNPSPTGACYGMHGYHGSFSGLVSAAAATTTTTAASLISPHLHACAGAYTIVNNLGTAHPPPLISIPKQATTYVL